MNDDEINEAAFLAAAFLFEGGEKNALELLLLCDVEFVPAYDYTTDTGFNGSEPDTFFLHGPRRVYEAYKSKAEEFQQIIVAFEASRPSYHLLKVKYKALRSSTSPWRENLARELPAAIAIEAEISG